MGAIVARLVPLLRSLTPSKARVVLQYLAKAGAVGLSSIKDVILAIKNNPGLTAMVASALVEAGVAVKDLFPADGPDAESAGLHQALSAQEARLLETLNKHADIKYSLTPEVVEAMDNMRDLIGWAKRTYGSAAAAREAHKRVRQFAETSTSDLEVGIRNYW